ncbi:MAG TPA: ROK family protein [Candidatus Faecivivens stercoripullorum]|uniref:ROK family protein n=1 Tax=Candidatus Faecivivens stercoripullorum TaxID=2840805 RepID=A0A9D1KRW7_9FIRM|nr:ROK family protein [Candidatus Faecivivens stercoripullorum]
MAKYLVIDNGGTFIKPSIMDGDGNILQMLPKIPTNSLNTAAMAERSSGKDTKIEGELDSVEKYLALLDTVYQPLKGEVDGIAMSFPGVNDAEKGYCYSGGAFLFAAGQPLGEIMTEHFGIPCTLENDGKCAVLAEYWKGALQGVQNGAVIALGTGIAGGIIVDGKIVRGRRFSAGEMSYMTNDIANPLNMASGFSSDSAMGMCMKVAYAKGMQPSEVDGFKVFELAKAGDPVVMAILDKTCDEIVGQAYNMTALLDLDVVAIGGGISREPMLLEMLQKKAENINANNPLAQYSAFYPQVHICPCQFHNEANMLGALYHHLKMRGLLA